MSLVLSYLAMMPRLMAEAQLMAVRVGQLSGSAQFDLDEVKSQIRDMEDAANPNTRRPRAKRASPEALAAMGIGMVRVPSEAALHDG
jgi:hypothetical protein